MKTQTKVLWFIIWVGICLGVGGISSIFTFPAVHGWYQTLIQPAFNPPDWIFGPVWTLLYILMGIAAYLVWMKGTDKKCICDALFIFAIQLTLNFTWTVIFFRFHCLWIAFANIIALIIAIGITTYSFKCASKIAAYLMIPYLLWVIFAALLNIAVAILNP